MQKDPCLIENLELVAFLNPTATSSVGIYNRTGNIVGSRSITADGAYVYHSIAELNKRSPTTINSIGCHESYLRDLANIHAPLYWDINVREVVQYEVHEGLVPILAEELDERLRGELLAQLIRREAVLAKEIIKIVDCLGRMTA